MDSVSPLILAVVAERKPVTAATVAVQQVRRMRGGSQSHLMRCSDRNFYVVKFKNNPQHLRVLANEMFAGLLGRMAGLPLPEPVVLEVGEQLIQNTPELSIQLISTSIPCQSGLQFGSRYAVHPLRGTVVDYLPATLLGAVRNLSSFAGVLVMDKWTGNSDRREAVFWRMTRQRTYDAMFIDQGYCFNGGEWNFPDAPLRGVYAENEVYANVYGWESFEPWLSRIEDLTHSVISAAAEEIPPDWYGGDSCALDALVRGLADRRTMVRGLLTAFRLSPRRPFPNWGVEESAAAG